MLKHVELVCKTPLTMLTNTLQEPTQALVNPPAALYVQQELSALLVLLRVDRVLLVPFPAQQGVASARSALKDILRY